MNKKAAGSLAVLLLLAALTAIGIFYYKNQQSEYLILYGNVDTRTVNLGFRVSGRLASLSVDEGDKVTPGRLLAKLDDAPYVNALNQAQANTAAAQANLDLLKAGYRREEIDQTRAAVAQAQANYDYAQSFLTRQQGLWTNQAISANELASARANYAQAQAQLQQAKDKLTQYQAGNRPQQIAQAQAQLHQAQAAEAQAQLDLKDTLLYAPSSGIVMTRVVEPGTMLSAGHTVFSLSLTQPMWVRAYVGETYLGRVVPGSSVEIYSDSRPDKPYHGIIGFVSPNAEFTPKTVETPELRTALVYRLRIVIADADEALRQGMPVTLKFHQAPPAGR